MITKNMINKLKKLAKDNELEIYIDDEKCVFGCNKEELEKNKQKFKVQTIENKSKFDEEIKIFVTDIDTDYEAADDIDFIDKDSMNQLNDISGTLIFKIIIFDYPLIAMSEIACDKEFYIELEDPGTLEEFLEEYGVDFSDDEYEENEDKALEIVRNMNVVDVIYWYIMTRLQ